MADGKIESAEKILGMLFDNKTDSVSVTKTTTGKYSWDIKVYNDDLTDDAKRDAVLEKIKGIDAKLRENFKDGA